MLATFVWKIKQQMFYWLWKCKSNTLINIIILSSNTKYMVWSPFSSVLFHNVIVLQCYFLYLNTLLARYTEVNATVSNLFYMNISIWRTVNWKWECFTKWGVLVNHVSIIRLLKSSIFFLNVRSHLRIKSNANRL